MCILLIALEEHADYDLIVAANRDEFHARPSVPATFWHDAPWVLAGRDLRAGGSWLGVDVRGRFAAVTNLRGAVASAPGFSRGNLVRDFLREPWRHDSFIARLDAEKGGERYAGCNLVIDDVTQTAWWSAQGQRRLEPGVHGLSNTSLDEEWPKVGRLKAAYEIMRGLAADALVAALLEVLRDCTPSGTRALEESIFVSGNGYGTRCSTVVLRARAAATLRFVERRYDEDGNIEGESRYLLSLN
jgi:uncharacterized protein with NRDE domain